MKIALSCMRVKAESPFFFFLLGANVRAVNCRSPPLSVGQPLDGATVNLPLICLFRALLCSAGLGTSQWTRVYSSVGRSGFLLSGAMLESHCQSVWGTKALQAQYAHRHNLNSAKFTVQRINKTDKIIIQ